MNITRYNTWPPARRERENILAHLTSKLRRVKRQMLLKKAGISTSDTPVGRCFSQDFSQSRTFNIASAIPLASFSFSSSSSNDLHEEGPQLSAGMWTSTSSLHGDSTSGSFRRKVHACIPFDPFETNDCSSQSPLQNVDETGCWRLLYDFQNY